MWNSSLEQLLARVPLETLLTMHTVRGLAMARCVKHSIQYYYRYCCCLCSHLKRQAVNPFVVFLHPKSEEEAGLGPPPSYLYSCTSYDDTSSNPLVRKCWFWRLTTMYMYRWSLIASHMWWGIPVRSRVHYKHGGSDGSLFLFPTDCVTYNVPCWVAHRTW